jgi:hypothetical protein
MVGIVYSLGIAFLTKTTTVKSRATIMFIALLIVFLILYVPQSMVPFVGSSLATSLVTLGLRVTDFVGYIMGEGWLSQIWLILLIVNGITYWTRTRKREARVLKNLLYVIFILGILLILCSFLIGHPIKAFE